MCRMAVTTQRGFVRSWWDAKPANVRPWSAACAVSMLFASIYDWYSLSAIVAMLRSTLGAERTSRRCVRICHTTWWIDSQDQLRYNAEPWLNSGVHMEVEVNENSVLCVKL